MALFTKFIKRLLITSSLIVPTAIINSVAADEMIELAPYLGIDIFEAWMQPKSFYKQVFPRSYPSTSLYVGTRVAHYFGFELGYDWSLEQSKSWTIANGQSFFGSSAVGTVSGKTIIRRSGAHLDILGIMPVQDFEIMAALGYGWVQAKIVETNFSVAPGAAVPNSSAMASMSCKGRGVIRASLGANYMITELFGVRAKIGWESTSMVRVKGNGYFSQLAYKTRPFVSTKTLGIGLFYKF